MWSETQFKETEKDVNNLSGQWLSIIIYILMIIATMPWLKWSFAPTGDTLDTSWAWALGYAVQHNMQWGKNFLFTYGPLGFVANPYFYSDHALWGIASGCIFSTRLVFGLLYIYLLRAIRTSGNGKVWPLWLGGLSWIIGSSFIDISTQAALIAIFLLIYSLGEEQRRRRLLSTLIGAGFLFGFASLIKSTGLIVATFILVIYPLLRWYIWRTRRSLVLGIMPLPVFALTFAVLFVSAGQHLENIPSFIYGTVQIAKGYTPAMSIHGKGMQTGAALFVILLSFISGLVYFLRRNTLVTAQYIVLGVMLFWAWKEGFTRHDPGFGGGHAMAFFGTSLAVIAIMVNISFGGGKRQQYNIIGIAYLTTLLFAIPGINLLSVNQIENYKQFYELFTSRSARNTQQRIENKALVTQFPISKSMITAINHETVNIVPWNLMMAQAYHWTFVPSPVIQAYSVYTPYLDHLNATQIWNNHGAQNILYTYESIDGRYPLFDEPATFRAILYNYRLKQAGSNYSLLEKNRESGEHPKLQSTGEVSNHFGKWIAVPKDTDYADIFIQTTLLGHLANIFYKPSQVHIYLRLANGSVQGPFRFIYPTASDGLFLRYFVANQSDLNRLMSHDASGLERIIGVKMVSSGAGTEYGSDIHVKFFTALHPIGFFSTYQQIDTVVGSANNQPLPLMQNQTASVEILPTTYALAKAGWLRSIGVLQGNYGNTANGQLMIRACSNGSCVSGVSPLSQSKDNSYFYIILSHPLFLDPSKLLTLTIKHVGGTRPDALWLWPQIANYGQHLKGPKGNAINKSLSLHFNVFDQPK